MAQWKKTIRLRDVLRDYNTEAEDELAEVGRWMPKWIARLQTIPELHNFIPLF